ncbi:MAG: beta strand repeat-containing protein, partial [Dolichospermum sp.]
YIANGVATTNSNTIGSQSATGSIVVTSTTTAATDFYGILSNASNNWTTNSNLIGGITFQTSATTNGAILYGLRAILTNSLTWTCNSNSIGGTIANSIINNTSGTAAQTIGILNPATNGPISSFTSNTIRNLTAINGTGTSTSASVIGISSANGNTNHTISQNIIFNLSNTHASNATVVTGIQFTGSTANTIERNLIYGLTSSTTSTSAEVNGIRVNGGTTTYRNNIIAIGAGISNALGTTAANSNVAGINGINEFLGTNNFWHNSVYIGGTATAGSGASYAFNGVQTGNTRSFRNNIFVNARTNSGATGSHYAIKINATTQNPTGLTINNNVYFANGTGGVLGYYNSGNRTTITDWRAQSGQDVGSVNGNPAFNNPTAATPDLHIHVTNPSVAESAGVDLGVTDDYDGQTRSGLTPVDIGADAGNFVANDVSAPTITYTNLIND